MSRTAVIVSDAEDGRALCRLCMIYHECFVGIFIPNDAFRICAEEAIHDLLSLKIAVGDGLPSNICHQCVNKLMEFRDFKEMCLKTAEELRKYYLDNFLRVLLHPGFNVYINKGDKIGALSNGNTPKKLQEELLLRLFGKEYVRGHSAKGQRVSKGGNPAACRSTMDAVDAYVKTKFKGEVVPRLSKTYNNLAKNLRVSSGYQAGKYRYTSQKRKPVLEEHTES